MAATLAKLPKLACTIALHAKSPASGHRRRTAGFSVDKGFVTQHPSVPEALQSLACKVASQSPAAHSYHRRGGYRDLYLLPALTRLSRPRALLLAPSWHGQPLGSVEWTESAIALALLSRHCPQ